MKNTLTAPATEPWPRSFSPAREANSLTASTMPSTSVTDFPKERDTRICWRAAGSSSSVMHRVPRSSSTVFSVTTENWRRMVAVSQRARSSAVRMPVSVPVTADIRIELHRGATAITLTWPANAASECAVWMRELLR